MKVCTKCNVEKDISEFTTDRAKKDGVMSICKPCKKEYIKLWYLNNKERKLINAKEYYEANKEKILQGSKARYLENIDRHREAKHKAYWSNPERAKKDAAKWYYRNHHKAIKTRRNYRKENREKVLICQRVSNKKYYEKVKNEEWFVVKSSCRRLLRKLVLSVNGTKDFSTEKYHGYSFKEFKEHIEAFFDDGMCWQNHGEWHIDHVTSISDMLKSGIMDAKTINALSNIRPLWAKDNLRKAAGFDLVHSNFEKVRIPSGRR
jgi:hypothetical protein